jgi:hypothetical protein
MPIIPHHGPHHGAFLTSYSGLKLEVAYMYYSVGSRKTQPWIMPCCTHNPLSPLVTPAGSTDWVPVTDLPVTPSVSPFASLSLQESHDRFSPHTYPNIHSRPNLFEPILQSYPFFFSSFLLLQVSLYVPRFPVSESQLFSFLHADELLLSCLSSLTRAQTLSDELSSTNLTSSPLLSCRSLDNIPPIFD